MQKMKGKVCVVVTEIGDSYTSVSVVQLESPIGSDITANNQGTTSTSSLTVTVSFLDWLLPKYAFLGFEMCT